MSESDLSVGRPPGIERPSDPEGDGLSIGNVCHVLQNERRRLVLSHLRTADGVLRTSELAERIAASENDTTPAQLNHRERKRVYISLYQVHLPTLDDVGAVRYDSDRGTIEPLPEAERLYDALDRILEVTAVATHSGPSSTDTPTIGIDRYSLRLLTAGFVALVGLFLGIFLGIGIGSGISGLLL